MKEIKNTTIYTKEQIKKFLEIFYFEKIKYPRIIVNILILIIILYFLKEQEINAINIIAFIFSLFGIIELNTTIIPKLNYNKILKRKDSIINTKINYVFKKNNFKVTTNKNEFIEYSDLKKVIEIDTAYYLYINNSRAFIVDKEVLNIDEIEYLTNTFKEKISTYKYKK